jgi:hypothetical protein
MREKKERAKKVKGTRVKAYQEMRELVQEERKKIKRKITLPH